MAFMGMFMIGILVFIIIVGIIFTVAVISLIISIFMQLSYKKKLKNFKDGDKKPRKWYYIPRIISILNFAPLIFLVVSFAVIEIKSNYEQKNSLAFNVTTGNYERAEELLEKGVSPDCTFESNKPAKDGKQTLLSLLCEKEGFVHYSNKYAVDRELTQEEIKMIKLLIEYGANVNAVDYVHEAQHSDKTAHSIYMTDDRCGYTPLMHAVYNGNTELVKLLIENGADVNVRDYTGFTPVATVADSLNDDPGVEILRILIENGADIINKTNYGQSNQWLAYRNTVGTGAHYKDGIIEILGEYNGY